MVSGSFRVWKASVNCRGFARILQRFYTFYPNTRKRNSSENARPPRRKALMKVSTSQRLVRPLHHKPYYKP